MDSDSMLQRVKRALRKEPMDYDELKEETGLSGSELWDCITHLRERREVLITSEKKYKLK